MAQFVFLYPELNLYTSLLLSAAYVHVHVNQHSCGLAIVVSARARNINLWANANNGPVFRLQLSP